MPTATAFDWTGNQTSIFSTLAASNHSKTERQADDYYATDPIAVEKLLEKEHFNHYVWECAAGGLHISNVLTAHGYKVRNSDITSRGNRSIEELDFFKPTIQVCKRVC